MMKGSLPWQLHLPLSRLKCALSDAIHMQIASFTTNFMVRLACCSILVSSQQWIGWSSIHVCLTMADLSLKPLVHVSLCSFRDISNRRFVLLMYIFRHFMSTGATGESLLCCYCCKSIHRALLTKQLNYVQQCSTNQLPFYNTINYCSAPQTCDVIYKHLTPIHGLRSQIN